MRSSLSAHKQPASEAEILVPDVSVTPRLAKRPSRNWMPLVPLVIGVTGWWVAGAMFGGLRGQILSPPPEIAHAFWDLLSSSDLWSNLRTTVQEFVAAFAIAYVGGLLAGLIIGSSLYATRLVEPFAFGLYAIPKISLLPILLAILGLTPTMVIVFAALHGILPVFLATVNALKNLKPVHTEVALCLGASRLQTYQKVVLRAIMLPVIAAARICFTLCFLVVITAEIVLGGSGMGHLVMSYYQAFDYPSMYAAICFTVMVCALAYLLASQTEKRLSAAVQ